MGGLPVLQRSNLCKEPCTGPTCAGGPRELAKGRFARRSLRSEGGAFANSTDTKTLALLRASDLFELFI